MKHLSLLTAAALFTVACGAQEIDLSTMGVRGQAPMGNAEATDHTGDVIIVAERGFEDEYPAPNTNPRYPDTSRPDAPNSDTPRPDAPPSEPPSNGSNGAENPGNTPIPGNQTPPTFFELAQDFKLPEPSLSNEAAETLWATYYYLPEVDSIESGFPLLDSKGNSLGAKLSNKDWCSAAMEGSVRVRINGIERTFNYASSNSKQQVDCSAYFPHKVGGTRFKVAKGPFGDGVKNYMLVPFRTIAVDRNVIPYGSLVYIPAAKGTQIKLPDGRNVLHDGYFFAGDTGSAIKENHIDVFIGVAKKNPFPWVKSSASKTFEAHIVENKEFAGALNTLHTKK